MTFSTKIQKCTFPVRLSSCALDLHMQMNTGHCPLMVWKAPQIWLIQNRCSHVFLLPLPPKPGDSHFLGHSGGNLESHPAVSLNGLSGLVSHTPHDLSYLFLFLNHHHHSLVSDSQHISRIVLIAFPPVTPKLLPYPNPTEKRAVTEGRWQSWQIKECPFYAL